MNTSLSFIKASLFAILFVVSGAVGLLVVAQPVVAACPPGSTASSSGVCHCPDGQQLVSVPVDDGTYCVPINKNSAALTDNPIFFYLRSFLIFLAGGVGLAVVGGIVAGSYMYITARANASQVQQGQTMITNSVIGLLLFIFMYAILQFIIPGGIFQ
ncbi:MAG TPA: hypothetical protein VM581_00865 [Magnetospirillaceae bacterium]|nr:hypothetical protein [Magnetospirillaceae bacterium]